MLYLKNVPNGERVVRLVMGLALLGAALWLLGSTTVGWTVGAMGLMAAMSGLIGYCPMCALAGRRLAPKD